MSQEIIPSNQIQPESKPTLSNIGLIVALVGLTAATLRGEGNLPQSLSVLPTINAITGVVLTLKTGLDVMDRVNPESNSEIEPCKDKAGSTLNMLMQIGGVVANAMAFIANSTP